MPAAKRTAAVHSNPKLVIEPTLAIAPDVPPPQVNLADAGDPFGRLGPKSSGPGSGGRKDRDAARRSHNCAGIALQSRTGMRVVQGLGLGLDEKAIDAVRQWSFRPG